MIASLPVLKRWRPSWFWPVLATVIVLGIVVGHLAASTLPVNRANPLVIATHLYALLLASGLLWLGLALGRAILRPLGLTAAYRLSDALFSVAVGLGALAYLVLTLGLSGVLHPAVIAVALLAVATVVRRDLVAAANEARSALTALLAARRAVRQGNRLLALCVPLLEFMLGLLMLQALAPPTGYDALMYHLTGPKRFLELGRIAVLPDVQQANMPFTVDLLYLIGLALGSDELAGVLHLAFALALTAAIFSFGREFVSRQVGAFGAVIFLSGTVVAVYAPMANVDFGLALFDFLAVYAFVRWLRSCQRAYLLLCGSLLGLALGTKYLGGITALALGVALLWHLARLWGTRSATTLLADLLAFGLPALLIAAPWYAKNWLWLGSPVWPFLAPGEPDLNIAISANVNLGREWFDYLLLPWRMYFGPAHEYPLARPPLLLWLLPLYLLLPKHRVVTGLLALAGVHVLVWSQGAHVIRYLTSALPLLSLGAAYVLAHLARSVRLGSVGPALAAGLLVCGLALATAGAAVPVAFGRPFLQTVGLESREEYLLRQLPNHSLVTTVNGEAGAVRGVLLLGDRRVFYVEPHSHVDVSLKAFQALATAPNADAAREYLDTLGVSHVLVSAPDLEWHARYDPEGRIAAWWVRFRETQNEYLEPEARYYDLTLYRVKQ
ncbi:MAG: glycosyltransferase family 39 protein [Chloroflexota bacterium]